MNNYEFVNSLFFKTLLPYRIGRVNKKSYVCRVLNYIIMILDQFLISKKTEQRPVEERVPSEGSLRSIVKSVSWRVIGTIDTIIISWFITGEMSLALSIGTIELVTKMVLYFFHERLWNLIKWGKI